MSEYKPETVVLDESGGSSFLAMQRGYELKTEHRPNDETVFTASGEYAIYQNGVEQPWQLVPGERMHEDRYVHVQTYAGQWATAEALRTQAGNGTFLPGHMDLIDLSLFAEQKVANPTTELTIASEDDLADLLAEHGIATDDWRMSVHDLYNYVKPVTEGTEIDNVRMHCVDGELWLASDQSMMNVYFAAGDKTYRLRETEIVEFDGAGNESELKISKVRSSMGETGHIVNGGSERPYLTARRGLRGELGIEEDSAILNIVSTGSNLRIKRSGHPIFAPIKAQDRTHYFDVQLNPQAILPEYINDEYDPDGNLRARIKLEWFEHPSASVPSQSEK